MRPLRTFFYEVKTIINYREKQTCVSKIVCTEAQLHGLSLLALNQQVSTVARQPLKIKNEATIGVLISLESIKTP